MWRELNNYKMIDLQVFFFSKAGLSKTYSNYWNKDPERSIIWNDPFLKIDWPRNIEFQLSNKDALAPSFKDLSEDDLFD